MIISIVIASANRAHSLSKCLESIARLNVPADTRVECVVVDNNSKDSTAAMVKRVLPTLPFDGKYCFHPVPGSSGARNVGVKEASGDIIAFTDDDCVVDQNWIVEINKQFTIDRSLSVIGGRVMLYNPDDLPVTIKTSDEIEYLKRASDVYGFLHGCNLIVRREVFNLIGYFDERFGAGTRFRSAEDTDFVYRAFKSGQRMAYMPTVCVYHNHGRSNPAQMRSLLRNYKVGQGAFYLKNLLQWNFDVIYILLVQLRPPVRRWISGPERFFYFKTYVNHLIDCSFLLVGASYFFKACRCETDQR